MSAELDSIIASAAASIDAGGSDGGDTGNTSGSDGGEPTVDLSGADTADAGTDAGAAGDADATGQPAGTGDGNDAGGGDSGDPSGDLTAAAQTADDIVLDAELAALGLAAPKPGQRDNRIPYSRLRKIVANAKTKWADTLKGEHTKELSARDQKIKDAEERQAVFDRAERLIASDPDQYVSLLAKIYPDKYGRFAKPATAAPKAADVPQEPQPDIKYDDGTVGYSPTQFAKLREYDRQQAALMAKDQTTKEFNERFGPIEQQYKQAQQTQQDIQRVRGHIGALRNQWGGEHIDNPDVQKAIIAHMDANPKATLVEAARTVVMGRISADLTTMRAELLKELQGAPKAAVKAPVAPNRSDATNDQSIDDIIAAAARSLR